jgi:signal transduction histidine kinase
VATSQGEFAGWLIGSLRTGLIAVDGGGCVAFVSPEAARVLELGEAALVRGRPLDEVLAPHPALRAVLCEGLRGHELPSRAELELTRPGGSETRPIGFTLVSVRDEAGAPRGAAVLFRDLTPFERKDEQERLRDRLAALGQMAAGLAHEIRNPLASIQLLVELLERELADRPGPLELVGEVLGELQELTRIVNGSLAFVRPHAATRAPVQLSELVDQALVCASARVPFDGRLEVEVPIGLRPSVDALQLERTLVNLIVNAFEAMRDAKNEAGKLLRIEARLEAGELQLSVADTGPGIPLENRERIFYPFFTTREQGTGVGLAEVHKMVVSHGGSVEVRERPGGGALFVIHLPLEERV